MEKTKTKTRKKNQKKNVYSSFRKSHFWHRAATCSSQNHVTSGRLDMMMDTLCKNYPQPIRILERRQKLYHTKIRTSASYRDCV